MNRVLFVLLLIMGCPLSGLALAGTASDSINVSGSYDDSTRQACIQEIEFIIDQIEASYISGRRGLGDEEWNQRRDSIYNHLQLFLDQKIDGYYVYVWRYLNLLKSDAHFRFPDDGMFNRWEYFKKDDYLFPLWVQTWKDGSVYNVKDYSGTIPRYAKILSINGRSAKEMALSNRALGPGEEANAVAMMNAWYEATPSTWPNLANYMFMESMRSPFRVVYSMPDSDRPDTVVVQAITRGEKNRMFKRSGDKRRVKEGLGFSRTPVVYKNTGDSIGVLSINSFLGKRWSMLMLSGKDQRYKRLLRQAMRRIDRNEIKDLIIDVSLNSGGMAENVYYTLNYLTDKSVDMNKVYRIINDQSKEKLQTNISRSPEIAESDRERLIEYIGTLTSGTVFSTDTVCNLQYFPNHPKHSFRGNVYVLTSPITYSAAQMFARYCQTLGIGPVAGQHCGGYTEITGGNTAKIILPMMGKLEFEVSFGMSRICKQDDPYDYPPVDILIDRSFDEWLHRENRSLEKLVEMLRSGDI